MYWNRVRAVTISVLAMSLLGQLALSGPANATGPASPTTAEQLTALSYDIFLELAPGNAFGADLSFTTVDQSSNRVEVGVVNYDPDLRKRLEDQFGADLIEVVPAETIRTTVFVGPESESPLASPPDVTLNDVSPQVVGTCIEGVYCAPTRGGVYLQQQHEDGERIRRCTATIVGTNRNGRNSTLTAGHCFTRSFPILYGTFHLPSGFPVGAELGWVGDSQFLGSSDHAVIPWTYSNGPYLRDYLTNCLWVRGITDCARVSFNASGSDLARGSVVVQSGYTTGNTVGTITEPSMNIEIEDPETGIIHRLTDMVETSACSLPGDSGGAAYSGDRLIGTISAGVFVQFPGSPPQCHPTNPRTYVAKSTNAFYNLGFSARLTP